MRCAAGKVAILYTITILQQTSGSSLSTHHVLQGNCNPVHIHYHTTRNWVVHWAFIMCCRGFAILYTITILQQGLGSSLRAHHVLQGICNPVHIHYHTTRNWVVHWALIMCCREIAILYSCSSFVSNQHVPAKKASVSSGWPAQATLSSCQA